MLHLDVNDAEETLTALEIECCLCLLFIFYCLLDVSLFPGFMKVGNPCKSSLK